MIGQKFSCKDPSETYDLCFDFSYILQKWERIPKPKITISVIDLEDNSDASFIVLDKSRQRNTYKKISLRVMGGAANHDYAFSVAIESNKGTKTKPLVGILPVRLRD